MAEKAPGQTIIEIIIGLIFVGFFWFILDSCSGPPSEETIKRRCENHITAYVMSQQFVEKRLKSPSSAKFPMRPDRYEQIGECSINLVGSFEAANSFGVMLRGSYSINMEYRKGEDTWYGKDLVIYD